MNPVFYLLFFTLLLYALVLLWLALGYLRTSFYKSSEKKLQIGISIIICARNEEQSIAKCLDSILKQDYVLQRIQLILINDASNDRTVQIAEALLNRSGVHYKIISNQQRKGKKASITYAMQFVNHELVVSRDADTFTKSTKWLQTISDQYNESKADLIIGPVALANNVGLLWALQAIENNILTLAAAGSAFYKKPFLCSGANLVFTKNIFERTKGYSSHQAIESGDDILFMEEIRQLEHSKILFLKSKGALVYTYPCYSFQQLLAQKTRWASKFKINPNKLNLALALLTFAANLGWVFCFAQVFSGVANHLPAVLFISLKLLFDFLLLFLASGLIKNRHLLWYSLPAGCVYPIYAVLVGLVSLFKKPKW